jgi:hypothetical protein
LFSFDSRNEKGVDAVAASISLESLHMPKPLLTAILVSSLMAWASPVSAQDQDLGRAELAAEIIGARVSDPMGTEIGEVADVSFDEDGQPDRLRVKTSSLLGFGERTVEVSRGTFMLLRGHVVLELSADELRSLPDVGDDMNEKRAD